LLDAQNRHLLVNRSYADLLNATPADLVGKTLHDLWPAAVADTFVEQNHTILETGQLLQLEDTLPVADGIHSYLTVKFPLYDTANLPVAIGGISTDITERKNLEAQFYQAQRLESLGILAGGIAHDLNNVLTPILTTAQLLRLTQPGLDASRLKLVNLLETSAQRGASLVKQMLALTRTNRGERTPVDLAAVLQEEMTLIRQSFPKSIDLRADCPPSQKTSPALGMVLADPTYLHQILLNLCINARDAMPDGGTLTISAAQVFVDATLAAKRLDAQVGHYAVITIADTGIGISPEVQQQMFDPFFTTKPPGQGTGLGLSTVRSLVKAQQGFLEVFSQVGQGSQFKVYLPLMPEPDAQPDSPQPTPTIATNDNPEAVVLVVEDEDLVRNMLQALLETHHYHPLLAQHGAEALDLYRLHQSAIQLVITDLMMPTLDGFTFIERIKAINPDMPIIALSGIPSHAQKALAAGATCFTPKPFGLETLLNRIATLLHPIPTTDPQE
jgi:signal transduction histidine kinase/ActR/RegA family two-component response regulator